MGYEIVYSFHRRLPDGQGYNKEETETINRRIGEPFDEVPLDKVAAAIMQQMARRDVWVVGVEIHEYKKNKVTFRETDGGIVIKNRKFQLDQGANLISQELKSVEINDPRMAENGHAPKVMDLIDPGPMPVIRASVPQADPNMMPAEQPNPKRRVRRWVVFQPELPMLAEARQKGLKCTENKKYPVFDEKEHPMGLQLGMVYTILDDLQREIQCSDKYFVPATVHLDRDSRNDPFSNGPSNNDSGGKLIWPGEIIEQQTGVPDVRRAAARGERLPPPAGFDDGMGGSMEMPMPDIRRGRGR
jgi:hypothetical protein